MIKFARGIDARRNPNVSIDTSVLIRSVSPKDYISQPRTCIQRGNPMSIEETIETMRVVVAERDALKKRLREFDKSVKPYAKDYIRYAEIMERKRKRP